MELNMNITTMGWHPPTYVKITLLLNFIIMVWLISHLLYTYFEYLAIKKFVKEFKNSMMAIKTFEDLISFLKNKTGNSTHKLSNCLSSGLLDIFENSIEERPDNFFFRSKIICLKETLKKELVTRKNRLILTFSIAAFSTLLTLILKLWGIFEDIDAGLYSSLKIASLSFIEVFLPIVLLFLLLSLFTVLCYLVIQKQYNWTVLDIENMILNLLKSKDLNTTLWVMQAK